MGFGRLHPLEFRWTGEKPCHIPLHGVGTQLAPSPHLFSTWRRNPSVTDCLGPTYNNWSYHSRGSDRETL